MYLFIQLKARKTLMERCTQGSTAIYDEVKIIGPGNKLRIIRGFEHCVLLSYPKCIFHVKGGRNE